MNIWQDLEKPLIFLAPMDGYTDRAYREINKLVEPRVITVCEFTSADALAYDSKKSFEKIAFDPKLESPYVVQIFGKNLENFEKAVDILINQGVHAIDINMGCPAKKVVKSEHGSALRKNCAMAMKVAEVCVKKSNGRVPISVKTRLGWMDSSDLVSFGKSMESVGVAGITIHGRTYQQAFSGAADWEPIYELKENLNIPVIGNGDVVDGESAKKLIGNLDGVMVGRATFGNPWVMGDVGNALLGKSENIKENEFLFTHEVDYEYFPNKLPIIKEHAKKLFEYKGIYGMLEFRKTFLAYVKGFRNAKNYRKELVQVESPDDVEKILEIILKQEFNIEYGSKVIETEM